MPWCFDGVPLFACGHQRFTSSLDDAFFFWRLLTRLRYHSRFRTALNTDCVIMYVLITFRAPHLAVVTPRPILSKEQRTYGTSVDPRRTPFLSDWPSTATSQVRLYKSPVTLGLRRQINGR